MVTEVGMKVVTEVGRMRENGDDDGARWLRENQRLEERGD